MELNGEEKRIRALFRELRREDSGQAPLFAREWARAQSRAAKPGKRFALLRVAAVLVVICFAVVGTVLLSKQKMRRNAAKQIGTSPITERQLLSKGEGCCAERCARATAEAAKAVAGSPRISARAERGPPCLHK